MPGNTETQGNSEQGYTEPGLKVMRDETARDNIQGKKRRDAGAVQARNSRHNEVREIKCNTRQRITVTRIKRDDTSDRGTRVNLTKGRTELLDR